MTNPAIPTLQRAWVNIAKGSPSKVLVLKDDWPVPKNLKREEILVRVQAAALNPVGYGLMKHVPSIIQKRPRVPEFDLAGEVVDANGSRFKNGDQVFGWVPSKQFRNTQGTLQQYVRVDSSWVIPRPPNVSPIQASGFALTVLTAYLITIRIADVQAGQRVFVNGGSTSVGAFAIQLAKIRGAHVIASASAKNEAYVKELGADEFVDYTKHPSLSSHLSALCASSDSKYHHFFETVGLNEPSLYFSSDKYLYRGGSFVSVGAQPKSLSPSEIGKALKLFVGSKLPKWLRGVNVPFSLALVWHKTEDLKQVGQWVEEGLLKPRVDSVYEFEDALKAYEKLMTKRATGKVVIKVDPFAD